MITFKTKKQHIKEKIKSYENNMRYFLGENWKILSRKHKVYNVPLSKFDRAAIKWKIEKDGK